MTEIAVLGTNEKRIICGPTINQLVPFRYPWAWEWYLDSNKNHWTPSDINMAPDISDYKFKLSADDRHLFITMLATLTTADVLALRNVSFAIMEKITAPEVQAAYSRHAYEESIHMWTYQHCIEGLCLDPTEIYTLYQRVPEINAKFILANRYLQGATEIRELTTKVQIEDFLYSLLFFCLIFEGVWFYNGFSPLLNFQRRGEMKGTGEQLQYILRDETNHVRLGVNVARAIIQENNITLDTARLHRMFKEAYDVNEVFIKYAMRAGGTAGLSLDQYLQHERYMSNRRLAMIGIEPVFTNADPTLKWLDEQAGTNKEKNFFETRVNEYQVGVNLDFGATEAPKDKDKPLIDWG